MKKKFTLGRLATSLLMVMAMLPLAVNAQECDFTPNLFPGQAANRTEHTVSATVHVGEYGQAQSGNQIYPFVSSNPDAVVAYSSNGYDATLFFVGVGTAQVTYTEKIPRICESLDTINYTVEKGFPTAYFRALDGGKAQELTVAYTQGGGAGVDEGGGGGGTYVPSPIMQYMVYNDTYHRMVNTNIPSGEITYTSSDEAVATISSTGAITVNGLGTTTLRASWPGNTNWEAADVTLALTVKKNPNLSFSPGLINDSVGKVIPLHVNTPDGVTISRWSSTNTNIATVDNEGNVTLLMPGSANIYAIFDGNAEYAAGQCACMVNVSKAWPRITFTPSTIKLEKNVDVFTPPVMNKPDNLQEIYNTTYHWVASNTDVASVNAQTGAITLNGATGVATITYVFEGDTRYLNENARYYIEVTTSGITVMGQYATKANGGDIFGNGSVIYTEQNGEKNLTLTNINFNATGGTFIESTSNSNLNIYVRGNCRVTNAAKGIDAAGPLYIWCENKKDTILLDASNIALHAAGMKVIDCYLFANGGLYGIFTNDMAVWAGGYIFAQGTTEAIHTNSFTKGEASIGGIEALTKGVTFVAGNGKTQGGFYTDYEHGEYAHILEIGKVPLPVANDKVKDINFSEDDPYDNLDVVFSESANDTFNDGENQIEIKTTTTDQQVSDALELYVTCSSEFLKALPGVLVFDVPAGQGEIAIQCELGTGYKLQVNIEGKGTASIEQVKAGWAVLSYNVVEQTHVIVYLQAAGASSAPAKTSKQVKDPGVGASIKAIKITPSTLNKYYVVGSFNSWDANENYRMVLNEGAGTEEYMFDMTLTTTDQFKVVKPQEETPDVWYPNGTGNNYGEHGEITSDGEYTIYFRPLGNGGDDWFYHVIYLVKKEPSAIDNTNAEIKAMKVIRNGQLFIEKNGHIYNAFGVMIK